MEQPENFEIDDEVCLLSRAIYGLKQASRVGNFKVDGVLRKLGYAVSDYDACIYFKMNGDL